MRVDLQHVADFVEENSRVLDLGCGDGELLAHLQESKNIKGYGIEKDQEAIEECIRRGVNVIEHDLNFGLDRFPDDSFDIVVMTETLQALESPRKLLKELLRIANRCIVSFPNFGHWQCRFQLLFRGRMPVAEHLPHQWYDTPNIHLCTFRDFDELCQSEGLQVVERSVVDPQYRKVSKKSGLSNLFGTTGFYVLGRPQ
ncbi:MAG: methionine biosynthesis protein MetW [Gammaproteobacteria bacterium]|nr:methionine biosynthesis protein MetW [Gammaproteobacteria bacterium]